jgi:hypothetical protein
MACAAWGTAPAHAAISITETDVDSFRYTTAPGWDFYGSQVDPVTQTIISRPLELTASNPGGDGWLRLTETVKSQKGMALYDTDFLPAEGLQVTFEYATYGGAGADGIAFFLIDGSTASPALGDQGGGLGYKGMVGAYVGIGLDEYGNFDSPSNVCIAPCPQAHSVAVLGAESRNFGQLGTTVHLPDVGLGTISTSGRSGARTVRITISPVTSAAPYPKVTVEIIDPNTGNFATVFDSLDLSSNGPVPDTFKMGFSASTGFHVNYHEIRIKDARTLVSAVPMLGQSTLGTLAVLLALLTLPALRRRFRN